MSTKYCSCPMARCQTARHLPALLLLLVPVLNDYLSFQRLPIISPQKVCKNHRNSRTIAPIFTKVVAMNSWEKILLLWYAKLTRVRNRRAAWSCTFSVDTHFVIFLITHFFVRQTDTTTLWAHSKIFIFCDVCMAFSKKTKKRSIKKV